MTRAEKIDGVPTVPSRWLLRLRRCSTAWVPATRWRPRQPWLGWARSATEALAAERLKAPEPRPAVEHASAQALASRASKRGSPIPTPFSPARSWGSSRWTRSAPSRAPSLRGSIIHEALSRFAEKYPTRAAGRCRARAGADRARRSRRLRRASAHRRVLGAALRTLRGVVRRDRAGAARRLSQSVVAETSGSLIVSAPAGPFTLTARADRIDVMADGLVITDYKTGTPPNDAKVTSQHLRRSCRWKPPSRRRRRDLPACRSCRSRRCATSSASGGEPPGEELDVKVDDVAALASGALDGLAAPHRRFDDPRDALPAAAPRALLLRLRRLRASGARGRVVIGRDQRGGCMMGELPMMKTIQTELDRTTAPAARRRRPARLGVGQRQRRHRQDARADHARAAPAAGRHRARAHPLPHLHQGRAAEMSKRVFDTLAKWVDAVGRRPQGNAGNDKLLDREPTADEMAHGAHAVRARHRDAGRPQGADHPRLLRAAAAALPAGSRRAAGLHHSRRRDVAHAAGGRRPTRCSAGVAQQSAATWARRCRRRSPTPPTTASMRCLPTRSDSASGSKRRNGFRLRSRARPEGLDAIAGAVRAPLRSSQRRDARLHLRARSASFFRDADLTRMRDVLQRRLEERSEIGGEDCIAALRATTPYDRADEL